MKLPDEFAIGQIDAHVYVCLHVTRMSAQGRLRAKATRGQQQSSRITLHCGRLLILVGKSRLVAEAATPLGA
jgi:hypothetical protein